MSLIKLREQYPPPALEEKSHSELLHTVYAPNGNEYTGEWKNHKKHGKGIQVWKKSGSIYDGDWKYGKPNGYGTYSVLPPGENKYVVRYFGAWKNGKKHGIGTYYYSNLSFYEGEWIENLRSGWGIMRYENADIYEGEWMNDETHGQGTYQFVNGNWYEGSWREGKKSGRGKFCYSDKGQLYEGVWVDGIAKCGTLSDFGREEATTPTKHPIPQVGLVDMELVVQDAQSHYLNQC
ncbi:MORN repeat-containing protein 3 [Antennarius striatus]|uniref:MORN repeat-containing protein 3 n=1 Tax=Antennarius striatus TaxID=241820 RepID=UPI0035B23771